MARPSGTASILAAALLAASLFSITPASGAEPPPVETVDFAGAVGRALRNNAAVAVAGFDLEAGKRDVETARSFNLPSVTLEEHFVRSSAPGEVFGLKMNRQLLTMDDFADPVTRFNNPAPVSDFITSLTLEQPLFAPQAMLGWRMAQREAGARANDVVRTKEETAWRVVAAWLGVMTAKEFVGVAGKALEAARQHHDVAIRMEQSGLGLASDGLRARVAVAEAESASVNARNRLELARKGLAMAMGEKGGVSVDAAGEMPPMPAAGSLDERIALALNNRKDLAAISTRVGNADANVDLQRAGYLPTVGFRAGYRLDGGSPFNPDNRSWNVGVGLKWNVFDGLRREASTGRARIESGKAREQLRGAGDQAAFQVSQAWLSVSDAESRLAIAREAVAAAEEGVRLIRTRYENQMGKLIDVLDAQAALDAARAGQVRAGNDLRQAQADLELASGTLLPWATQGIRQSRQGETK